MGHLCGRLSPLRANLLPLPPTEWKKPSSIQRDRLDCVDSINVERGTGVPVVFRPRIAGANGLLLTTSSLHSPRTVIAHRVHSRRYNPPNMTKGLDRGTTLSAAVERRESRASSVKAPLGNVSMSLATHTAPSPRCFLAVQSTRTLSDAGAGRGTGVLFVSPADSRLTGTRLAVRRSTTTRTDGRKPMKAAFEKGEKRRCSARL